MTNYQPFRDRMMNRLAARLSNGLFITLLFSALTPGARAQVVPALKGGGQSIWVGGQYSNFSAGFPYQSGQRLGGVGVVGTFNWNHHYGLEANADFLNFGSFHGETEHSLMAGPRYTFLKNYHWRPFAVFEAGGVRLKYPFEIGTYNYTALGPGGGVEYRLDSHWLLRAEYRYDFLLNSPHFTNEPKFGIQPNGLQLGVSYRLHGWFFPR
jgi:opacity protein-like surface antigen